MSYSSPLMVKQSNSTLPRTNSSSVIIIIAIIVIIVIIAGLIIWALVSRSNTSPSCSSIPFAATNVQMTNRENRMRVTWDVRNIFDHCHVYISSNPTFTEDTADFSYEIFDNTSIEISDIPIGKTYYGFVIVHNECGNSLSSPIVSINYDLNQDFAFEVRDIVANRIYGFATGIYKVGAACSGENCDWIRDEFNGRIINAGTGHCLYKTKAVLNDYVLFQDCISLNPATDHVAWIYNGTTQTICALDNTTQCLHKNLIDAINPGKALQPRIKTYNPADGEFKWNIFPVS